jgi:hypothetical protein
MHLDRWIDDHRVPTRFSVWLGFLVFLVLLGLCVHRADAADAELTWTYPATNVDGTAIPATGAGSVASTLIEWGTCSGAAFGTKAGGATVPAPAKTYTVTGLAVGTHCFRAAVTNSYGTQSDWTGAVQKVIAPPKPNPPVIVTVNLVAYEVRWHQGRGTVLGAPVGTVALGTACGSQRITTAGPRKYYEVPLDKVDLRRLPSSAIVVAQCEARS